MTLAPHPRFDELSRWVAARARMAPWTGECYRFAAPEWARSHKLFSGDGARKLGGRWNAPGVAAAYTSLAIQTAFEEWLAQIRRAGIAQSNALPVVVGYGTAKLNRVLSIARAPLSALRLTPRALLEVDWVAENRLGDESLPQALGRAAAAAGCEALLVPSAVTAGENLVVFPGRLLRGSTLVAQGLADHPGGKGA